MPSYPSDVEEALVLGPGFRAGGALSLQNAYNRHFLHRPGVVLLDLEEVRLGGCGLFHIRGDDALSALVLPHASSSVGVGCHGLDRAEATSVCVSPDCFALGSTREGSPGLGFSTTSSQFWLA